MLKKMLSIILSTAMILGLGVPVYASYTDNDAYTDVETQRPLEEILNRYHIKNLELESLHGSSSRSVQTNATIKQDTINELHAAGYEAYDVNPDTYTELEAQLNTDFGDMGLTSDSSYIVVISGESSSGDRVRAITDAKSATSGLGDSSFTYTYEGVTYAMRFVTVTAADNSQLGETSNVDLVKKMKADSMTDILNAPISILTTVDDFFGLGTLWTLLGLLPEVEPTQRDSIDYSAGTNWTVKYTQIYDTVEKKWTYRSSVEYVSMFYSVRYMNYVPAYNRYNSTYKDGIYGHAYSDHYFDTAWQKKAAVIAHKNYTKWLDVVEEVVYKVDNVRIITHQRFMEYLGYEPK